MRGSISVNVLGLFVASCGVVFALAAYVDISELRRKGTHRRRSAAEGTHIVDKWYSARAYGEHLLLSGVPDAEVQRRG
ncbi:MAG: hypothetical protein ACJ735_06590 [Actinomycetes bacterium]